MRTGILACLGLLAGAAPLTAQAGGTLAVRVASATTGRPVPGAAVALAPGGPELVAGPDGRATFRSIPGGVYSVRVRAIGFTPFVQSDVVVSSGKPATLTVELWPRAIELDALLVAPYFQPRPESPTSTNTLTAEEVRRAPGVNEDVIRAVALLPGVAVASGGRNDLVVRGGAPFENLFLVDNVEVPNLNHFGSQGSTGGPLSLINIDFVRSARFSAGGFGVRYGDRTSAMTAITLRDGNAERVAGELNISATGAGAILEGPLGGGSFLLGARRSYLDFFFKAAGFSFVPSYWDFTARTSHRLDDRNTLSFLAVAALDEVTFFNETAGDRYDNSRILSPGQRQYFSGITWQRLLPAGLLTVTAGRSFTRFDTFQRDSLDPPRVIFRNRATEGENSLRADLSLGLSPRFELSFGNVVRYASRLDYMVDLPGNLRRDAGGAPQPLSVDTAFTAWRNAAYAQGTWLATPRVQATLGLRADHWDYLADGDRVSPRAALSVELDGASRLNLSAGRYYQAPPFIWLVGDSGNAARLRPIRADQAVAGLEYLVRPDLRLQVEAYYKWYRDYPARLYRPQAVLAPSGFEDVTSDIPFGLEPLDSRGRGRAWGIELLAQKRLSGSPWYGLLSLSLGRSEFEGVDGVSRPGAFDTRAIGTLLVGYRPDPRWEVSGKLRVAGGQPTTPFITAGAGAGQLDFTRYNAGPRLPVFHALDLRVDRRWSWRGVQLVAYLDVANVYGRSNVSRLEWNYRKGTVEPDESLGLLPSIGLNLEF